MKAGWQWRALNVRITSNVAADYNLYLGIFYTLAAFLVASAAICIFVGVNFKRNHFPFLW